MYCKLLISSLHRISSHKEFIDWCIRVYNAKEQKDGGVLKKSLDDLWSLLVVVGLRVELVQTGGSECEGQQFGRGRDLDRAIRAAHHHL